MPLLEKLKENLLKSNQPKTPAEVVTKLVTALEALSANKGDEKALDRAHESVAKYLLAAKLLLFGDDEHEATKENAIALAHEAGRTPLLSLIVNRMVDLEFESRKDAAQVFGALVRIKGNNDERGPGIIYVQKHPEIPTLLFNGWVLPPPPGPAVHAARSCCSLLLRVLWCRYDEPTIALNCGAMLRDCLRDDQIAKWVTHMGTDPAPTYSVHPGTASICMAGCGQQPSAARPHNTTSRSCVITGVCYTW